MIALLLLVACGGAGSPAGAGAAGAGSGVQGARVGGHPDTPGGSPSGGGARGTPGGSPSGGGAPGDGAAVGSPYRVVGTAFAGVLVPLDRDGDRRVDATEYAAVAGTGPAFAQLDTDGDGGLSAVEVRTLILATDPLTFDPGLVEQSVGMGGPVGQAAPGAPGQGVAPGPATPHAPPPEGRAPTGPAGGSTVDEGLVEALRFEEEEIAARTPAAALPTDEELRQAATAGLASPAGRAVATRLQAAASAARLGYPPALHP